MVFNMVGGDVVGLPTYEQERLQKLIDTFLLYQSKNEEKDRYYEGKISLSEVNLGIALPDRKSVV